MLPFNPDSFFVRPPRIPTEGRVTTHSMDIKCTICEKVLGKTCVIGDNRTECHSCLDQKEREQGEIDKAEEYRLELGERLERMRERGDDDVYESSTYQRWSELSDEIAEKKKRFSDKFYR